MAKSKRDAKIALKFGQILNKSSIFFAKCQSIAKSVWGQLCSVTFCISFDLQGADSDPIK